MTPEEKIAELVEHIKKEFPKGCSEILDCSNCPLVEYKRKHGTTEYNVCGLLIMLS